MHSLYFRRWGFLASAVRKINHYFPFSASSSLLFVQNGFKLRLNRISNCVKNPVVKITENSTVSLSTKCLVTAEGCTIMRAFNTAKVKFSLSKNGLPMMRGTKNGCQIMSNAGAAVKELLVRYGVPLSCPVAQKRICNDATRKADISKFKRILQMARGKNLIHAEIEHDTNGYKIKVKKVTNCVDDPVIKLAEDAKIKLTDKCMAIPSGCVTSKGFATAAGKFTAKKNGLPVASGSTDLCKEMDNSDAEVRAILEMFGLPTACPVEAGEACPEEGKEVNVEKHKQYLQVAQGHNSVHAEIEHDTGKSCFDIDFDVIRP